MDISSQNVQDTTQPISDDQDLAKALAGISPDEPEAPKAEAQTLEDLPELPTMPGAIYPDASQNQEDAPLAMPELPNLELPQIPNEETPSETQVVDSNLESIKHSALNELRPLVDKIELSPEEKFDTYILLIRSTDDTSLIESAYKAAQAISDEKKKAQALLDVIKEIDYLSKV